MDDLGRQAVSVGVLSRAGGPSAAYQRKRICAVLLTIMVIATLGATVSDIVAFRMVATVAYVAFLGVAIVDGVRRDYYFLSAVVVLTGLIVATHANPWGALGKAFDFACFFSTFLLTLNVLRDAAKTSIGVRRCGNFVLAQAPGRRYFALTLASHLFAVILNYGVINLLGTMVVRSNTLASAGGDVNRLKIRERRMMLAVLRGQSSMVGWSPLSILIAVAVSMVPGLTWPSIAPVGGILAIGLLSLGWLMDRRQWPAGARAAAPLPASDETFLRSVMPMLMILLAIIALVVAVASASGLPMVRAVMLVVPCFAVFWIATQFRRFGPRVMAAVALRRLGRMPMKEFAAARSEVLIISTAAFIGSAVAALVPPDAIDALMVQLRLPWLVLAMLLAAAILAAGQLGINALVSMTLIGASLHHMTETDLPSVVLATAMLGGSSLSIGSSPYGTPVVLIAAMTGQAPETIGRRWNGPFTVVALGFLYLYLAALTYLLPR